MISLRRATPALLLAAGLAVAAPAAVSAQEAGAEMSVSRDSLQTLVNELQTLQSRIAELQDSAVAASPELQAERDAVQEMITTSMQEGDPQVQEAMDRLPAIREEVMQAQAAQDTATMRNLVQEGRMLEQTLRQAQAQAMQSPEVQAQMAAFREDLLVAMEAIDPQIQGMLERMETLGAELRAIQQGG